MKALRTDPINKVVLLYGVPLPTLKDCLSGRIVYGINLDHGSSYFNQKEESEHSDYFVIAVKVGYIEKTQKEVISIVENVAWEKKFLWIMSQMGAWFLGVETPFVWRLKCTYSVH